MMSSTGLADMDQGSRTAIFLDTQDSRRAMSRTEVTGLLTVIGAGARDII
jgi:hypothetical protein